MFKIFSLKMFALLGMVSVILILVIIVMSLIGGISYSADYTDRSWKWDIHIAPGKMLDIFMTKRQKRLKKMNDMRENLKDGPLFQERNRERKQFIFPRPPRPVQDGIPDDAGADQAIDQSGEDPTGDQS